MTLLPRFRSAASHRRGLTACAAALGTTALSLALTAQAAATIVGYPVVGGRRTIELSVARPQARFDIWADRHTYRVIRMVKYFRGGMRVPPITSDFDWVRSTAAMVQFINEPQVPARFTQVRAGQYYAANRRGGSAAAPG